MNPLTLVLIGSIVGPVVMLFGVTIGWLIKDRMAMVKDIAVLKTTSEQQDKSIVQLYQNLEKHDTTSDQFRENMAWQMSKMNSRLSYLCGKAGADPDLFGGE